MTTPEEMKGLLRNYERQGTIFAMALLLEFGSRAILEKRMETAKAFSDSARKIATQVSEELGI